MFVSVLVCQRFVTTRLALAVSQFFIDGIRYRGDPYADNWWFGSDGWLLWPVTLTCGSHVIAVWLSRQGVFAVRIFV
jgi:hypothetical protein